MKALVWKESREHALRFAVLLSAAIAAAFIFLCGGTTLGQLVGELSTACCWFLPAWVAATTVASEKSARTQRLLSAIPVAPWKVWTVKTAAGLVTVVVPVAAAAILIQLGDESTFPPYEIGAMLLALASIYLMTVALTLRASRETMAAVGGVIILLGLLLHISVGAMLDDGRAGGDWFWFLAPSPLAYLYYWSRQPNSLLVVQAVMVALWWTLGLFLYPRFAEARPRSRPMQSAKEYRLPAGKPSVIRMLAWREMREQGGVVLAAAVTGILVAALLACISVFRLQSPSFVFTDTMFMITIGVPPIVAVLLGISSWSSDLQPRIFEFWRSRPVPPGAIFWSKLAFGLLGVFALLACFVLLAYGVVTWSGVDVLDRIAGTTRNDFVRDFLLMGPPILSAILCTSILVTILVRRPIAAGLVIIPLIILGGLSAVKLIEAAFIASDYATEAFQLLMVLASAIMIALARFAVARNWRVRGLSGV